jgi:hypothetical protein
MTGSLRLRHAIGDDVASDAALLESPELLDARRLEDDELDRRIDKQSAPFPNCDRSERLSCLLLP